jgi:hypothetical protein
MVHEDIEEGRVCTVRSAFRPTQRRVPETADITLSGTMQRYWLTKSSRDMVCSKA